MNFYEAQDFFKKMYADKEVKFEFDDKCHRTHEVIYTDGVPNEAHHIENDKVKVTVEGMDPVYVPIAAHRECCTWDYMQNLLKEKMQ